MLEAMTAMSNFIWRAKVEPAGRPFMMNNFCRPNDSLLRVRVLKALLYLPRQLVAVAVETKAVRSAAAVVFVPLHPIWVHNTDAHPVRNLSCKYVQQWSSVAGAKLQLVLERGRISFQALSRR